ncbi:P1 family peptidase, partial [Candidatus Poribacteria bacterium]|nr:P1 family peptidase [Candidatus Poribacteria bacterium]
GIGFPAGPVRVPIVPAAVIFDLGVGDAKVRPDREMGYRACVNATNQPVKMGQIGVGAGATLGKAPGCIPSNGGVGSACQTLKSGLIVGAIVVVNALGNVVDPMTGAIVAGARDKGTGEFVDIVAHSSEGLGGVGKKVRNEEGTLGTNTTIGVVATNAELSPTAVTKVAQMAHDGLARAIRPAHTMFDGDTIFALSLGTETASSPDAIGSAEVNTIGIVAAEVMAEAILRAVKRDA